MKKRRQWLHFGKLHISQLEMSGLLINVQCLHVHIAVLFAEAFPDPGMGGSGEAPGPTNDVCLEVGGEGPENITITCKFLRVT